MNEWRKIRNKIIEQIINKPKQNINKQLLQKLAAYSVVVVAIVDLSVSQS